MIDSRLWSLIADATFETITMVCVSTIVGVIAGVPLGVMLFSAKNKKLYDNKILGFLASFVVNFIRSVPYVILMVLLMPLTRVLVGSSIGTMAAAVPLSIVALVLISRVVEDILDGFDSGLLDAMRVMGASNIQVITKLLVPEALPDIVLGVTLVVVNLIGFSAMAGTVGGGGLGDVAIRYGYQRYDLEVLIVVVLLLVVLVQSAQTVGNKIGACLRKA